MKTGECFQKDAINQWRLYWLICGPMALAVIGVLSTTDMATAEGVSALIALSLRWSVHWLCLAFAASSLHQLFSADWTRWLELYMPYWPFIPFLPLLIALPGALLIIRGRGSSVPAQPPRRHRQCR